MKTVGLPFVVLLTLFLAIPVFSQANGKVFTVNSVADTSDAEPGDRICADANGQCTLRAAVQEANSNASGGDIIIFALPSPSVIELNQGTLTLTGRIAIAGPGARRLTIRRSAAASVPFGVIQIPNAGTNAAIRGLTISNGFAGTFISGGGVRIGAGCTALLVEVSILNNSGGNGGGIYNEGNLTLTRSLVASNTAGSQGGGIYGGSGSMLRITNSTITQNSAATGGAVWNAGNMLSVNNTVTQNSATANARSIFSDSAGTVSALNTIIGNDQPSTAVSLAGSFTSLGNNLVTDARNSTGFANGVNNDQVSDNNVINPLLGNLADNGGQTDTLALLPGSPAVNAGNSCVWNATCPAPAQQLRFFWDQRRGYSRGGIFDTVDIGAYEFGTGSSSSNTGFGTLPPPGPAGRLLGAIAILTNVTTSEKRYAAIGPFGRTRFQDLGNDVWVFEIKAKRSGSALDPTLIAFPD